MCDLIVYKAWEYHDTSNSSMLFIYLCVEFHLIRRRSCGLQLTNLEKFAATAYDEGELSFPVFGFSAISYFTAPARHCKARDVHDAYATNL